MIDNEVVKYYENYREEDRITTNNARKIEFLTTIKNLMKYLKRNMKSLTVQQEREHMHSI